jgi:PAS domain S-box-containing protein
MPRSPRKLSLGGNRRRALLFSLFYLGAAASAVGLADRLLLQGQGRESDGRTFFLGLTLLLFVLSALLIYALLLRLQRHLERSDDPSSVTGHEVSAPSPWRPDPGPRAQVLGEKSAVWRAFYQDLEIEALRQLHNDQTPERTSQALLQLLSHRLGFALAELWVVDETGQQLELADHWKTLSLRAKDLLARHQELRLARGEGLPGKVWSQGKTRWEHDLRTSESAGWLGETDGLGLRSAIGVALSDRGEANGRSGALVFCATAPMEFDPVMRRLLTDLGRQFGSFLTRAEAFVRLQQDEQRYRSIVDHAIGRTGVGLIVLDRQQTVVWANDRLLASFGLQDQPVMGRSAREVLTRVRADGDEGTAAFVEAVLASYDDLTHLEAYEVRLHGSDPQPEQWLEYWSQPISEGYYKGGRIEYCLDITRRKRIQFEARRRAQQQASVADLGMRALAGLDLDTLMAESVQVLARDLDVEFSGWFEASADGRLLLLKAGVGWGKDGLLQVGLPAETDTHPGYTLYSSGPVIVEDLSEEARFRASPWLAGHGIRSGLGVALQGRDRPLGVLAAYAGRPRPYSEDDVNFARSVAIVLADAIDRAQREEILRQARQELELRIQVRTQELSSANRALQAEVVERVRAEDSARGLLQISQQLTRSLDPDELLDELVRESMRLVGAQGGCAGLRVPEGIAIRTLFTEGRELEAEYLWPPGAGLAGWVLENRKLYAAPEARADAQIDPAFRERFGIRSAICLPILDSQEEVIGFFELHNSRSEGAWSASDGERLAAVAGMASIAIQNALAYRKLQQAEEELSKSTAQLEEAQRIAQIGNWDWELQADRLSWSDELYRIYGLDPARDSISYARFMELVHPEDRGWLQQRMEQAYQDQLPFSFEHRLLTPQGVLRRLHGRGQVIVDPTGKPIRMVGTGQDVTSTKAMEEALSGQSRLYESLLEAQSDLGLGVIVTQDRRIVYANQAVTQICGYTPAELEDLPDILELVEHGQRSEVQAYLEAAAEGRAAQHCEAIILHKNGQRRNIEFSVKVSESKSGTRDFSIVRDVSQRVRAVDQLRRSEDQLRRLSAHLEEARESERGTIAREIHDELGQALTGLKMDVAWIEQRLSRGENGQGRQRLLEKARGMSELIDVTIQAVRRIATELRPGVLDDLGLIPAIEWQVGEFTKRSGIACSLLSNLDELEVDRRVATGAFRILQEALTNVARHSQATQVKVRLKTLDGTFHLEVEDNGIGIRGEAKAGGPSLGILGMQERAHLLGGEVLLEGGPSEGTRVRVRLPLNRAGQMEGAFS